MDENEKEFDEEVKSVEEQNIEEQIEEGSFVEIEDESQEAALVPVHKAKKIKFSTVFMVLLSAVLIGGSTYTIGYYNGQINLNESAIEERMQTLLEKNYRAEIFKSVKDYIEESGLGSQVSDADITEIYKNVGNSVVGLTSKTYIYDWFNRQRESQVTGSGVIFDETPELLFIVTNHHVISNATDVIVELAKDQIVNAKLVGFDEATDLAVISVTKSDVDEALLKEIKPIIIGDSDALKIGEVAIAIGNPLGYNNTVTKGIISAVDRQVDQEGNIMYIQTDAAVNPGNSGGALVNGKGELIGINTAKIADTNVEGMGFAIPTGKMMEIVTELLEKGYVARPYLGIGGVNVDENTADLYDIPMGVLVRYVYDDSPAKIAGVKEMDLIIGINDAKIFNMDDLTSELVKYKPGDEITLRIIRNEKEEVNLTVELGDRSKAN
ncbi:MAG TPA: peptidase S1 [Clostridiales bacterium UBA8960]|nr:peptidase S1 [Clostridiales bacterium UBA8960]